MKPVSRRSHLALLIASALGLGRRQTADSEPLHQLSQPSEAHWAHSATPRPPIQSDDRNDFVQVRDGKFVLAGKPFVVKGTNYFGSWRFRMTIDTGNGIEHLTLWGFYHDWDASRINMDFEFIRSQLNATALRIGTPGESDFAGLVRNHGYQPWYNDDGTITERYGSELIDLADIAYANGLRIQFCLLWSLGNEIAKDPDVFQLGGRMDRFYANQVRSVATILRNHPGVLGYSIGNEVLVNWPINGTHRSSFEALAAGFIFRRQRDLRTSAPRQLLTLDEGAATKPGQAKHWYAPAVDLVELPLIDDDGQLRHLRLADVVDYLGPHFYPVTFSIEDLGDSFAEKITDARQQLVTYATAAKAIHKPVVINEFGLQIAPATLRCVSR